MNFDQFNYGNNGLSQDALEAEEKKRLERYKKVYGRTIESEKKVEVRETIDIFETPLLFRKDEGLLPWLEMERRAKIISPGNTNSELLNMPPAGLIGYYGSDAICLSMPVPYINKRFQRHTPEYNEGVEKKEKEKIDSLIKINPKLNKDSIKAVIDMTTLLGNDAWGKTGVSRRSIISFDSNVIEKSVKENQKKNLIKEILENQDYKNIWLTYQKTWLTGNEETLHSIGEYGMGSEGAGKHEDNRKGHFLISPENSENFVVDPAQSGDYMFEVWGIKPISSMNIKGLIKSENKAPLAESLESNVFHEYGLVSDISSNILSDLDKIKKYNDIDANFETNVSASDILLIKRRIEALPEVSSVEYLSEEQAKNNYIEETMLEYGKDMGEKMLNGLDKPDSDEYKITHKDEVRRKLVIKIKDSEDSKNVIEYLKNKKIEYREHKGIDLKLVKTNVSYILNVDEKQLPLNITKNDIEKIPGVILRDMKISLSSSFLGKNLDVEHSSNFDIKSKRFFNYPDIDVEKSSIAEIKKSIFKKLLPNLEKLFPFQKITEENYINDFKNAVMNYIKDKFKVDPEKTTVGEFQELIAKRLGTPIYELNGDQVWPNRKSHEEIVKELRGKVTSDKRAVEQKK